MNLGQDLYLIELFIKILFITFKNEPFITHSIKTSDIFLILINSLDPNAVEFMI